MNKSLSWATIAARVGKSSTAPVTTPTVPPIYQTSVFTFDNLEQVDAGFTGQPGNYVYSRIHNPSHHALEQAIAELEGGEQAVVTASGMAAIMVALFAHVSAGERVLVTQDVYGGTQVLFTEEFRRLGITIDLIDFTNLALVEEELKTGARAVYLETISNPLMKVVDVQAICDLAHSYGALVVIDNTFASPYVCQPLTLGVDLVIHSLTKYLNGHSDVMGGVVVGRQELMAPVRRTATNCGPTPSPFDCWLVLRGLKTLALRMQRHCQNAMGLAEYLAKHPRVKAVFYPGLADSSDHALAVRQFKQSYGGMLSFEVEGGADGAEYVMTALKLCDLVPSLAGITTTLSHPAKTSHRGLSQVERKNLGIGDGLIRVSVGIEDLSDLLADFEQALGAS